MNVAYRSPLQLRAIQLLWDRDWHDYRRIVVQIGTIVPPGAAIRRAEKNRQDRANAESSYRNPGERKIFRETEQLIKYGAAYYARSTLSNIRVFEISPRGVRSIQAVKRIRLQPSWKPAPEVVEALRELGMDV